MEKIAFLRAPLKCGTGAGLDFTSVQLVLSKGVVRTVSRPKSALGRTRQTIGWFDDADRKASGPRGPSGPHLHTRIGSGTSFQMDLAWAYLNPSLDLRMLSRRTLVACALIAEGKTLVISDRLPAGSFLTLSH
jgi:hypothetical protein